MAVGKSPDGREGNAEDTGDLRRTGEEAGVAGEIDPAAPYGQVA